MRTIASAWMLTGLVLSASPWCAADVTLRIVTYNVTSAGGAPRAGMDTILQAIGSESVGGRIQPLDIIAMQEVQTEATTGQDVVAIMNGLYGAGGGVYARGTVDGVSTGAGTQGVVYNSTKLQLVAEIALGATGVTVQPRQTIRHKFHPVAVTGGGSDFYIYNGHWKAGDDATSEGRRQIEANVIRNDADALGQGAAIIYAGDFNLYRSTDTSFQRIMAAGNGQGFDPVNRIGAWHDTASFADVFTQAPALAPPAGLTGGGLDDRFDWQMVTGEILAGTPGGGVLTYITGSYHTFGNNGTVALNGNINDASNTALPGLANRVTVLNLLTTVSDHLPVVADYVIVMPGGTGACCVFTACSITTQAGCTGSFKGVSTVCGLAGNPTTCCPANFNGANGLSVQDIFDFLAAYFASSPLADFNGNSIVSVQDIFDFLEAYFTGC